FENTYHKLPEQFFSQERPNGYASPQLVVFNRQLAIELGAEAIPDNDQTLAKIFSGSSLLEGSQIISMAYAGHQFGHFVPTLGDGRAMLLGEVVNAKGERFDVQLKGPGRTQFSRRGDGRATIGSVLREYLISEAMHALGVPTTRSLAAVLTGEPVERERSLPGGILTRVSPSHIRVGTFEYFAQRQELSNLESLLAYSVKRHFPEIQESSDLALDFFKQVLRRQVALIADWMALGFIHGVMNTDNTSIAGVTIDYGPCAFLDSFDSNKVFSSIDRNGRYSYSNQPNIGKWNLSKLAEALLMLYPNEEKKAVAAFTEELDVFESLFLEAWTERMGAKLGLSVSRAGDQQLIASWLNFLQDNNLDFTLSFSDLSKTLGGQSVASSCSLKELEGFGVFKKNWYRQLEAKGISHAEAQQQMAENNPVYIPRNHQIEKAIEHANRGDLKLFHQLNDLLQSPFSERPENKEFAEVPSANEIVFQTFCGT
ncbi:UNVERIFIED_CONTAM: hypothetical protein GTU68_061552, partial [Idotea baltica]|nr:hypothetical protein [Idotea baltica]